MESITEAWHDFHIAFITKFREITDPGPATADEAARNAALKEQLASCKAQLAALQAERAGTNAAAAATYAASRAEFEKAADPVLDALDVMETAKIVYDQVESHIAESASKVKYVHNNELKSYGYQSKMISSLALTLEATRAKIVAGLPFAKELRAVGEELTDSQQVDVFTTPLKEFAEEGIATVPALLDTTRKLIAATDEAALSTAQRQQPAQQRHSSFQGWLTQLKVEVPGSTKPPKEPSAPTTIEENRASLESVVSSLTANQLEKALGQLTAPANHSAELAPRVESLKRALEGRLIADTTLRCADSLVALHRFRLLEGVLSPTVEVPRMVAD